MLQAWRTELTDQVSDSLIRAASQGCNQLECAIQARVHPSVLDVWLTEGRRVDGPPEYQDLFIRMGQALVNLKTQVRDSDMAAAKLTAALWFADTQQAYDELAHDMSGRDILADFNGVHG